jgi:glucose-1-phosphatase
MLQLNQYKTIIFDLGGVIINLKENSTIAAFQKLSTLSNEEIKMLYKPMSYTFKALEDYEVGKISSEKFREILRDTLKINADDEQIDHAWNQILGDIPTIRIEILKKLAKTHQLILLSNTNEIHIDAIDAMLDKQIGLKNMAALFHHTYYSFQIKDRKPNISIYKTILKNHTLHPSQTLFIDDNHANVVIARRAGIHSVHLTLPTMTMEQLF